MPDPGEHSTLKVLHIFRSPKGGLFRHVCDLVRGQKQAGLKVGVVCSSGEEDAEARLQALAGDCELGLHLMPMGRMPGLSDMAAMLRISELVGRLQPNIIHGHGAKGGAYARLLPCPEGGARFYTPHGGSLHFNARSLQGQAFFMMERLLRHRTEGYIFESEFACQSFNEKIGMPGAPLAIIHNGVEEAEFLPVPPALHMADFVYVGELRQLKGLATLIEAASLLEGRVTLRIAGDGPDRSLFEHMVAKAGPKLHVEFLGAMPARKAFSEGKVVVMPSHHESLPYVALEAIAAGKVFIATRVGGLPEIFGDDADLLVPPQNAKALAQAMRQAMDDPAGTMVRAMRLQSRVRTAFSLKRMVDEVIGFYRDYGGSRPVLQGSKEAAASHANITSQVSS